MGKARSRHLVEDEEVAFEIKNAKCVDQTPEAIKVLFKLEDGSTVTNWIPQSQVTDDSEVYSKGHSGTLRITQYIAELRGWL